MLRAPTARSSRPRPGGPRRTRRSLDEALALAARPRARRPARREGRAASRRTSSTRSAGTTCSSGASSARTRSPILAAFAAVEPGAAALVHVSGGPPRHHRAAACYGPAVRPALAVLRALLPRRLPGWLARGRRERRDAELGGRDSRRGRGVPRARRRRLRLDGQRACARNDPGRKRYRRYHHRRSTDLRPRVSTIIVKRSRTLSPRPARGGRRSRRPCSPTTPPPTTRRRRPTTTPTTTTTAGAGVVPDGVTLARRRDRRPGAGRRRVRR